MNTTTEIKEWNVLALSHAKAQKSRTRRAILERIKEGVSEEMQSHIDLYLDANKEHYSAGELNEVDAVLFVHEYYRFDSVLYQEASRLIKH